MRYQLILNVIGLLAVCGCGGGTPTTVDQSDQGYDAAHDHHGHAHHAHGAGGPHGGNIIELGDEEYHVEWVHNDETGVLTLYVLDSEMREEVPIEASEIRIRRILDDVETSVALPAFGDEAKSARFEVADKELIEALKMAGKGVDAHLSVEIQGKQFTAEFGDDSH